jgi:hypothetical protein
VLDRAPDEDGAFLGISDAALCARLLRRYCALGRLRDALAVCAVVAPVLAVLAAPLTDADGDGLMSFGDVAALMHGVAARLEPAPAVRAAPIPAAVVVTRSLASGVPCGAGLIEAVASQ